MSTKPKILHICDRFKAGGVATFVNSILALNKDTNTRHDLLLIFDHEQRHLHEYSTIHYLQYNRRNPLPCIRRILQIVKSYHIIMIHAAHPIVVLPLLKMKKKVFIFQHGMSVSSGVWLQRVLKKIWYSSISILLDARIVCSTEFAFRKARRLGIFLLWTKCLIIPFGIELNNRPPKQKTQKQNGVIKIGMAGRLTPQKRQDWVLRSLLPYSGDTKIRLKIAGDGPLLNDLKELEKKIQNNNVVVDFLGNLSKEGMRTFYNDLDLFVFPSKEESFGLVVLEALSHGVPVAVFSDVGGCLDVVQDRVNGFILQDGIKGLEELWQFLNNNSQILSEQRQFISAMDLRKYDISHTRAQLDAFVCA